MELRQTKCKGKLILPLSASLTMAVFEAGSLEQGCSKVVTQTLASLLASCTAETLAYRKGYGLVQAAGCQERSR